MNHYFETDEVDKLIRIFEAKGWSQAKLAQVLGNGYLAPQCLDAILREARFWHPQNKEYCRQSLWEQALLLKNEILRG